MRIIGGKHKGTKLYTLRGLNTRPTLDRVKEPLFSILQFDIPETTVLDMFAGSGALGLEALSRGASRIILCDKSREAIHIIEKNVDKLKVKSSVQIINQDYKKCLENLRANNEKIDIVFLDPPYETDYAENAAGLLVEYQLLNEAAIVIIETDRKQEIKKNIEKFGLFNIYDERKYGRAELLFLKVK